MLKRTDSQLNAVQRFEIWFGRQAVKIVLVVLLIVLCSLFYALYTTKVANEREQKLLNVLEHATKYAVTLTPDSRIATVEKMPIPAAVLKKYVRAAVLNYFLLDRDAFTKDGILIKTNPNKVVSFLATLMEKSQRIKNLTAFFDEKNKESLRNLYIYLKFLYGTAQGGKLPDIISADGIISNEDFAAQGNVFVYGASFEVRYSYIGIDEKWHAGVGKIYLKFKGYFNPLKGGELNPYGMKVSKFLKIKYIAI